MKKSSELSRSTAALTIRADALLEAGDLDGAATWRKIIAAIEALQAAEPSGAVH